VQGDHAAYDRARDDQKRLGEFRPLITHSFYEQSGFVSFHQQLLCDWLTIEELGLKQPTLSCSHKETASFYGLKDF
jgi:hypothetical protein